MRNLLSVIVVFLLLYSCKQKEKTDRVRDEKSLPEKVAFAHGFEHWDRVMYIKFTFNVDRDSTHFERSWQWEPKSNQVTAFGFSDTLVYNRNHMDSLTYQTNAGFTNDKFWLLAPFNLIWDKHNYHFETKEGQISPISGLPMTKLTIVYGSEGGYTPGDAYDFYLNDDYLIQEWVYRKSNVAEATMATTWEGYQDYTGLKLASTYQRANQNTLLYFDGLEVMMKNIN